jgi:hypothetical protein
MEPSLTFLGFSDEDAIAEGWFLRLDFSRRYSLLEGGCADSWALMNNMTWSCAVRTAPRRS